MKASINLAFSTTEDAKQKQQSLGFFFPIEFGGNSRVLILCISFYCCSCSIFEMLFVFMLSLSMKICFFFFGVLSVFVYACRHAAYAS